jgi:hypothetical protein
MFHPPVLFTLFAVLFILLHPLSDCKACRQSRAFRKKKKEKRFASPEILMIHFRVSAPAPAFPADRDHE